MRRLSLMVLVLLIAVTSFAQPKPQPKPPVNDDRPGPPQRCCTPRAYDKNDKLIGEIIRWDDRFQSIQLWAWVRYRIGANGDDVALLVAPESITSVQGPGGSIALFTTPDCSGNTMFAMLSWPPLMKRYAMVLPVGDASTLGIAATNAWLFITDPLPSRVNPAGMVFHSQWNESGGCTPFPAPGYTPAGTPFGGFWMTRHEDLYKKFKRPFYSK